MQLWAVVRPTVVTPGDVGMIADCTVLLSAEQAGKFALWCLGDLFSDLMPVVLVREGGELQHDRARQGLVPDLKLLLNIPGGQDNCLALD